MLKTLFWGALLLRLGGLAFNGQGDMDEFIFSWGTRVQHLGLVKGFFHNYGIFSYAFCGWAADLAELMPRFWWAPLKLMEIGFETVIYFALTALLPDGKKRLALYLYWLNPWFIVHGAFHGFWEVHTLSALAALLVVRRGPGPWTWFLAGMVLMAGAMFKPQALFYFVLPAGIYLVVRALRGRGNEWVWFAAGASALTAAVAALLAAGGAPWTAIPRNYLTVVRVMPHLCNECINVWRPVTRLIMAWQGQPGATYLLKLPLAMDAALHSMSFAAALGLIAFFSAALSRRFEKAGTRDLCFVMAFAAVAIPQFATKAHINHGYAGLVLLVPVIAAVPRLLGPWCAMVAIHLYAHLADFQLGRARAHDTPLDFFPWGRDLLVRVNEAFTQAPDALLGVHAAVNGFLGRLPREPLVTYLSAAQFLCAVYLLKVLYDDSRA